MRFGHAVGRGDDVPRRHHDEFTNVVLRAITFQLGPRLFSLAREGHLVEGLRGAWRRAGAWLPESERLEPTGLTALHTERGSLEAVIVVLPQPARPGETYMVCGTRASDPFLGPGDPDFFLLEADRAICGPRTERRTRLARWTRDGRRFDLGEGPLPEVGAMLDAIARVMAIGT
ncbi:hypothetical protein ACQEU5_09755 [Marinactinospora thermotolerans]|uniref:Uncharacterized protein n=1 Tax=Marinactinospora thermotolerans DSM 45154 TaxID=1122192 RepID=A0A1T4N9Y1_9ACTN|nr:hypothetical protein [Marinactinospora thermotolerans]SJZ75915.1 hypothetical protein SAMN02745673_01346 [Marinactinospora thermotolerans DSM 45154]